MPYERNGDLPGSVRNGLPAAAQTVFRETFNRAEESSDEQSAFAQAWTAVKNGWRKTGAGQWVRKMEPGEGEVHVDAPVGDRKRRHRKDDRAEEDEDAVTLAFAIVKDAAEVPVLDEDQRLVFGWLSVVEEDGEAVIDLQGHVIGAEDLEAAAYEFVLDARGAGEMHERLGVGKLAESMVFTREKQDLLGIDLGKIGWWVGFQVDADVFAKVKSGEYTAFSIGGRGALEDIPEAA